jgi:hypothetical protein
MELVYYNPIKYKYVNIYLVRACYTSHYPYYSHYILYYRHDHAVWTPLIALLPHLYCSSIYSHQNHPKNGLVIKILL